MEKKKVMVVDDEKDFLKITKLNLERTSKYEVMTVIEVKDVLSYVHSFRPDVILLDLLMPKVKGIEVCEILNNDLIGRGIPIIILSALDNDSDKFKAYEVGVVDYLIKPVSSVKIIDAVEKILGFK